MALGHAADGAEPHGHATPSLTGGGSEERSLAEPHSGTLVWIETACHWAISSRITSWKKFHAASRGCHARADGDGRGAGSTKTRITGVRAGAVGYRGVCDADSMFYISNIGGLTIASP